MIELLLLALALSMDAFAVAIGLGSKKTTIIPLLSLKIGLLFGGFQALMPLLGYLGGQGLLGFVDAYARWIAFGLLALIGAKMVYEGYGEGVEEEISAVTHKLLLTLAIATSIDAMAAGFSLMLLPIHPLMACALIGCITFILSIVGFFLGRYSGTWLESKAEIFGGVVLIAIGLKIALFA